MRAISSIITVGLLALLILFNEVTFVSSFGTGSLLFSSSLGEYSYTFSGLTIDGGNYLLLLPDLVSNLNEPRPIGPMPKVNIELRKFRGVQAGN